MWKESHFTYPRLQAEDKLGLHMMVVPDFLLRKSMGWTP
jgi:hypothetical protein